VCYGPNSICATRLQVNTNTKTKVEIWRDAANEMIPKATELWFSWLEWVVIMGGLWFVYGKSNCWQIKAVAIISLGLFYVYTVSFVVTHITYKHFRFLKSDDLALKSALALCFPIIIGMQLLVNKLVSVMALYRGD
jgi:hypothetical protein